VRAAILASSLVLASTCVAFADDGGIEAVGGAVRAMRAYPTITLEYEFVRARVKPHEVTVECVFVLQNRGPAIRATVGFPSRSSGVDTQRSVPFKSFNSWVDGAPVTVRELPDSALQSDENFGSWWVKDVDFARDQRRTLREVYVAEPGMSYPDHHWFEYVLETGATWAGPILSGDVVVTLEGIPPGSVSDASPKPTSHSPGEYRWHFTRLEPDIDSGWQTITLGWKQ
jgi:hypothetical protein